MPEAMQFDLVSPERLLLSEEVHMVTVPGTEGDFGVLARHMPVMSTIRPGVVTVTVEGQPERKIFVWGGFADVTPSGLTILAEEAIPVEELDAARLDQEIQNAEEDVGSASSDEARQKAREKLDHLRAARSALG